jgi:hypothetical protein
MNMKRMRGRNHRPNGGGGGGTGGGFRNQQNGIPLNRNHVFDSSGPEMRVRGTAQQLFEKYTQMARDASSNGDRVTGEAYYQHAEHYFRIISAINQAQGQPNAQPQGQVNGQGTGQTNGQGEPRPAYNQNGEQRAYGNQGTQQQGPHNQGNGDYTRRDSSGQDEAPREDYRQQEPRQDRPERRSEPRQDRPERQYDRPYEPRNGERKAEYQPRAPRAETGFRNEPSADQRIDISSALEAELAAAAAPAGYGEQPALQSAEPDHLRRPPFRGGGVTAAGRYGGTAPRCPPPRSTAPRQGSRATGSNGKLETSKRAACSIKRPVCPSRKAASKSPGGGGRQDRQPIHQSAPGDHGNMSEISSYKRCR